MRTTFCFALLAATTLLHAAEFRMSRAILPGGVISHDGQAAPDLSGKEPRRLQRWDGQGILDSVSYSNCSV